MVSVYCSKPCYYRRRLWKRGEKMSLPPGVTEIPKHFVKDIKSLSASKSSHANEPKNFKELHEAEARAAIKSPHPEKPPEGGDAPDAGSEGQGDFLE